MITMYLMIKGLIQIFSLSLKIVFFPIKLMYKIITLPFRLL